MREPVTVIAALSAGEAAGELFARMMSAGLVELVGTSCAVTVVVGVAVVATGAAAAIAGVAEAAIKRAPV